MSKLRTLSGYSVMSTLRHFVYNSLNSVFVVLRVSIVATSRSRNWNPTKRNTTNNIIIICFSVPIVLPPAPLQSTYHGILFNISETEKDPNLTLQYPSKTHPLIGLDYIQNFRVRPIVQFLSYISLFLSSFLWFILRCPKFVLYYHRT